MKIGNNGNLVLGPFDESTPFLMIVLMNCQTELRINHLTAVNSVAILESLLGNEVVDDLAKAATNNPVDSEDHMVLTSTEIYSRAKELICRTWVVPPVHPCDEAHFWLNGYVNKQNCRIWSEANPQVYVETPLHPEKLTVWCALWAGAVVPTRRRNICATIDLLKDALGDRIISRFGPVNRPPRSCDLTPLDYFLWGYVKSLVYADKPQTLDPLEDNIRRVIADIRPQMLEKVIENWTSRLDYIRAIRGSPMPEIIFKM
ncbi:uncharacterized protein TNCV_2422581 [Trichonephila clavipes]|nr:uncharacterized protein TNCV_2422581 [Trichonephila clavipes]